jgi:hypothetical protein
METFFAAILMTSPVWRFLPLRALLLLISNVPNHTSVTALPFLSVFRIAANVATNAISAYFLPHVTFATSSINSALFINYFLFFILIRCMAHYTFSFAINQSEPCR